MFFVHDSRTFQEKDDSNTVNGVQRFVATVDSEAITDEQARKAINQLHEDLESYRNENEVADIKSMKAAKEFISD